MFVCACVRASVYVYVFLCVFVCVCVCACIRARVASHSLAVSVKMNILLFSPGLGILLLQSLGPVRTFVNIAMCAVIQVSYQWKMLLGHMTELYWRLTVIL